MILKTEGEEESQADTQTKAGLRESVAPEEKRSPAMLLMFFQVLDQDHTVFLLHFLFSDIPLCCKKSPLCIFVPSLRELV